MKRNPKITDASKFCKVYGARAVIIVALDANTVAGASYGETKAECKMAAQTLDRIIDALVDGTIPVWGGSAPAPMVQDFGEL